MRENRKSLIEVFIVTILVWSTLVFPLFLNQTVSAEEWEEAFNKRKSQVQEKLNKVNSTINEYKKDIESLEDKQATLAGEINILQKQINETKKLITETKDELQKIEIEIDDNKKEIEKLKSEIKLIFIDIQSNQIGSLTEVLLSSQNLDQFLGRLNAFDTMQTRLNTIRKETESKIKELNANKELLSQTQRALNNTQALQNAKESELSNLLEQTKGEQSRYEDLVRGLSAQEAAFRAQISQIDVDKQAEAERRAAEAERIRLSNGPRGTGRDPGDGDYNACNQVNEAIPIPSSDFPDPSYFTEPANGVITAGFGCPVGYTFGSGVHEAVDIANGQGTEIRAMASGTVEWARFRSGWGNLIVIQHILPSGKKVYSAYAHLHSIEVNTGQPVSKGQRIGSMGGTQYDPVANGFGVHLHFMIMDETYEITKMPSCSKYWGSKTYCYNPFLTPFRLY